MANTTNVALTTALDKLGEDGIHYLTARSKIMNKQTFEGKERLAAINEGRIDGYLRALKHTGLYTDEELQALADHFPDDIEGNIE